MSTRTRQRWSGLLVIGGLLALWQAADVARRSFIKALFVDGAVADSDPPLPSASAPGLAPAARVRVILLDGLSAAHADTLPHLTEMCAKGQPLTLDVGFPTVSLPVQHVLWTGLTQQQSGVQYHIGKLATPAHAIPSQVDSVAVAESHPEIVHSFGFTSAAPPLPVEDATGTPPEPFADFPDAARAAVAGPARLAFVHVLRIDDAGHRSGGASPEYAAAATWADELLATLWARAPADPQTRWFILADHGHRPAGGHGDGEPEIRRVRACVIGGPRSGPEGRDTRDLHLVDLARALADSLGVALDPAARGRPWSAALADPAADATLPGPGPLRTLLAALLALTGLLALPRTSRAVKPAQTGTAAKPARSVHTQPRGDLLLAALLALAWPLLGWLVLTSWHGVPSLSNPVVFPPRGLDMLHAAAPAMLVLVALAALAARRNWSLPRIAGVALAPWFTCTLAALVLARAPEWLARGLPPLTPGISAEASVLLAQGRLACLVLAISFVLILIVRTLRSRD